MFNRLGVFVSRHWLLVILGWIALAIGIHRLAPDWDQVANDGDLAYLPDRMTSVRGTELLAKAFPDDKDKSQVVLIAVRNNQPLTEDDKSFLVRLAGKFEVNNPQGLPIVDIWTPASDIIGAKLVSPDRHCALALLTLSTEFLAVQNLEVLQAINMALDEARESPEKPAGLELAISGSAAIGGDVLTAAKESIEHTELMTVLMVLVILALVYRAPVLVLVPLLTLVISVFVSTQIVALLTQAGQLPGMQWFDFKVFKTTKIFIVTILFGAGTDFCLFLISRYREEITRGFAPPQALAQALGHVGEAITASAMTTIFGLSMMFFADFGKFRNSGPAIGLCLLVALIACLTLAPALLRLFGRAVFWPFGAGPRPSELSAARPSQTNSRVGRFWEWIAARILAHPGLILLGSIALLSPLAYAGSSIRISYDLVSDLPPDRPCVAGTRILQSHFSAGELGPVTVVAYQPSGEFDQESGRQHISLLTKALYDSPDVVSVRSIAEPLGDKPGKFNPFSPAGRRKLAALRNPRTMATFLTQVPELAGKVTQLQVVLDHDPFSVAAAATLDKLDDQLKAESLDPESPWHGAQFEFVGVTAGTRDLKAVTRSDQRLIERLVTLAVLGILLVVLRRPLVCVYLIASVLFSYYVTIGATQLVFEMLDPGFQGLDWKVPIFLFVILIAVGEDYNIFLMTRVLEEQQRWGLMEGLRRAVVSTGGIITSCGVIMAGTFVSMMTGTLRAMLELGFALTLGVMLDTLVVRPILVPAFLALLYRFQRPLADRVPGQVPDVAHDDAVPRSLSAIQDERKYRTVGR